ncbi:polysaccharide biosynthesis/export family protein [Acetobacteraceae bacterium B3987]|nr:polysaccharide biosynthesis/export family protein [Acetobacteraceae bacterium B3987]
MLIHDLFSCGTHTMTKKTATAIAAGFLLASTSGCAFMPSTGPHASYIKEQVKKHQAPPLYDVDTVLAQQLANKVEINDKNQERNLLDTLNAPATNIPRNRVSPGDQLRITIWTQGGGQLATSETSTNVAPGSVAPGQSKMGIYSVDAEGKIDIPYAGLVKIAGVTTHQAQNIIRAQLAATHQFETVEVSIQFEVSHGQNIIVMGAVNKPTIINWNDGGISLAEAIAQAGGYVNGEPLHGSDLGLNVFLARAEQSYDIPLRTALLHTIQLQPGDRIALQHKPNVRVLCLGAGWTAPRMSPFSQVPTLSQVMASVNGLNPQTAQGRAVFVLKKDRSVMYRINFDRVEGMEASQIMPIEDGDMVYAPASRSVTMQQVLGMFMFIAGQGMNAAAVK